jgi:chromosome segregation ATPase
LQEIIYAFQQLNARLRDNMQKYKEGDISYNDYKSQLDEINREIQPLNIEFNNIKKQLNNSSPNSQANNAPNPQANNAMNPQTNGGVNDMRILSSNTPEEFIAKLFQFGDQMGTTNIAEAFDKYAESGATFQGTNLRNHEKLVKLYYMIINTPGFIKKENLISELKNLIQGDE